MLVFLLILSVATMAIYHRLAPTRYVVVAGVFVPLPPGTKVKSKVPTPRLFLTSDGSSFSRKGKFYGKAHGNSMDACGIPHNSDFFGTKIPKTLSKDGKIELLRQAENPIVVIEPKAPGNVVVEPNALVTEKRLRRIKSVEDDGSVHFFNYFDGRPHTTRHVDDVVCIVDAVAV